MRYLKTSVVLIVLSLLANSCNSFEVFEAIVPDAAPYPQGNSSDLNAEAQQISDNLDAFIQDWLEGKNDGILPASLLPNGSPKEEWGEVRLVKSEEVNADDQWIIREAEDINPNALLGAYPDPHCTYLLLNIFFAPFGHTAVMEGEFPYSRFFGVNVSPAFDPRNYYYDGIFGVPEVPMVDVDILPEPGNVNPFQPGANRQATNRRYQLRCELAAGDPVALEPTYQPPHFRSADNDNTIVGGALQYQGPLGTTSPGHNRGPWFTGEFWARYYAPDEGKGPLAGVELPRVYYETPEGERYAMVTSRNGREERLNTPIPASMSLQYQVPNVEAYGPTVGWFQALEIMEDGISQIYRINNQDSPEQKQKGRDIVVGFTSRGGDQSAPRNYMSSTSRMLHIDYSVRNITIEPGYVAVLTGRLPNIPKTLSGESTLEDGDLRYMSITTYPTPNLLEARSGFARTSLMDEDITLDAERNYIICYSRDTDRPQNATVGNNVTWVNRGEEASQDYIIRMMNIYPNWKGEVFQRAFDEQLTYANTSWLSPEYNDELIGINGQSVLGDYLPTVHYMRKTDFEAMSNNITLQAGNPVWK